jgi:ABC-2 type transport system permease protein
MISESVTLAKRSLTKWIRSPFALVIVLIQGIFWLLLFGNSFNPANAFASTSGGSLGPLQTAFGGASNYITFMAPGIIAILALTNMAYSGAELVMDKIDGYLGMLSTYPIPRSSIYFGGVLQNLVKAMVISVIAFVLAIIIPNGMVLAQDFGLLNLLGVFAVITLFCIVFATFFAGVALSVKNIYGFNGLVNFLIFPIMFTSTALFPISFFPDWLKPIAEVNPLSLVCNAVRLVVINGSLSASQVSDFALDLIGLSSFAVAFAVLGTLMARNALRPK